MHGALLQALAETNIDPKTCVIHDRGDGALVLVPASIPGAQLIDLLPTRLNAGLLRYNATCADEAKIRLRMSLHAGDARMAEHGIVGDAVNFACRLVDSDSLRHVHRQSDRLISIIVSDHFYREVVVHEPAAQPELYRQVSVREKEVNTTAWIRFDANSAYPRTGTTLMASGAVWATSVIRGTPESPSLGQDSSSAEQGQLWPLVNALSQVPFLADPEGRDLFVRLLGDELQKDLAIRAHRHAVGHLFAIAEVCRRHPDGLAALFTVLSRLDQDAVALSEIRRVVGEMTALALWSDDDRQVLLSLLAGIVVPGIDRIYRVAAGPTAPDLHEPTTHVDMIRSLERLNAGPSGVPRPVIFVERIAASVRPDLAAQLRAWSDRQADRMEIRPELERLRDDLQDDPGSSPVRPASSDAYLVMLLQREGPTGDLFRLSHWRQLDSTAEWAPVRGTDLVGDYPTTKSNVAMLIGQAESEWVHAHPDIHIEFVLDYDHLNLDVDQWPWDADAPMREPIGCRYSVVVRSLERMVTAKYHGSWRKRWFSTEALVSGRGGIPPEATYRRRTPGAAGIRELVSELYRRPELVAMVLREPPDFQNSGRDEVAAGVRAGVPVMIWHRENCLSPEFVSAVDALLHSIEDTGSLLERGRLARILAFEKGLSSDHFGGQLTILYDDPLRVVVPSQSLPPEGASVA
jgi:hypothetical protein